MVMLVKLAVGEILILSCHLCLISHTSSSTACFALNFRFFDFLSLSHSLMKSRDGKWSSTYLTGRLGNILFIAYGVARGGAGGKLGKEIFWGGGMYMKMNFFVLFC